MAGKHRTYRTDIRTHPKTAHLYPLDRDILLTQVIASNIAGVMRKSVAQIAHDCGGGTKASHVRAALKRLSTSPGEGVEPVVRWWPELEVVWATEAADEQARNPKAWVAVDNVIDVLPPEVQAEFRAHYVRRYSAKTPNDKDPDRVSETLGQPGYRDKGTGLRVQGSGGDSPAPSPPSRPELAVVRDVRRERDHALDRFHELVRWIEPPKGCGGFVCPPQPVYDLLSQGQTPEDIVDVLRKAVERINAGDIESRMWGAPLLKGWYAPIRDGHQIGRRDDKSKPSGPKIETIEEALAYASEHQNCLPEGWRWDDDGRGNHTPVRLRGGAA